MRVETVSDTEIRIYHERIEWPMRVRQSVGKWWTWSLLNSYGDIVGVPRGTEENMMVAIEKAMVDLEKMVFGDPRTK